VLAALEREFEVELHDSEWPPTAAELLELVRGRDGLVLMPTDHVSDDLLAGAGPQLRVVANYAVGYDNVDVAACTRRGVLVTKTPDVLTDATAELAIALVLALLRRVAEGDRLVRRREPWIWGPTAMLGRGLSGLLLALVGYGRIGRHAGELARALGLEVAHSSRSGGVPLDELLARADVVSLHLPLTFESRHLIDAEAS
jgi:glyoxylate reductase